MRLPRPQIENCCVHITHRCQERRFLLGTDIDRQQYVRRLREASLRFFVREIAAKLFDAKRALRKRLARGTQPDSSAPLFAYRRLDPTL